MRQNIAFDDSLIRDIINGSIFLTIRYGWETEDIPSRGELVNLVDSRRDTFAQAEITDMYTTTIQEFANRDYVVGHKEYDSPEHMCEALEYFYDDNLTPETEVTVISFHLWNVVGQNDYITPSQESSTIEAKTD